MASVCAPGTVLQIARIQSLHAPAEAAQSLDDLASLRRGAVAGVGVVDQQRTHRSCPCISQASVALALFVPWEADVRILVANDDGIYSPGLIVLARAAARFGSVRIVAPDVEQSGMAFAVTSTRPLHHRRASVADFDAFRVDGTPADCVALGMHVWGNVDVVLSGVNLGLNVGNAMWHSGTLAAAKQGVLLGVRAIAFSAPAIERIEEYATIAPWVERVMRHLLAIDDLVLLNVNVPSQPRGMAWTRQSVRRYDGRVVATHIPTGARCSGSLRLRAANRSPAPIVTRSRPAWSRSPRFASTSPTTTRSGGRHPPRRGR